MEELGCGLGLEGRLGFRIGKEEEKADSFDSNYSWQITNAPAWPAIPSDHRD